MTGSLQKKNNKYYVVINYRGTDGKIKRKWISTGLEIKNNKIKAQKILQEYLDDKSKIEAISKNDEPDIIVESRMLFSDFLDNWIDLRSSQLSPMTVQGYKQVIGKIKGFFAPKNMRLNEIKPTDIEEYYKYLMESGVESNTVLHHHVLIRKALDYAAKNDLIMFNPADKVERPKKGNYHATIYNQEELEQLFKAFRDTEIELPVYLAALYGLRRSEVLGLKWDAIDFDRKSVEIRHKVVEVYGQGGDTLFKSDVLKNDSSNRTLPLIPKAEEVLKKAKEKVAINKKFYGAEYSEKDKEYICLNSRGELIRPSYLTNRFEETLRKKNMKRIRFHDLRHSCASAMLAAGVPMKQIQEWLGHSNFSTTADIYSHLDYSSKIESGKSVEKIFDFSRKNKRKEKEENLEAIKELLSEFEIESLSELREILIKYKANL